MKVVLTIAGSDSCAGAGIQADLKTFSAHGLYAVTTVTAVTAQSPSRITATHIIPTDIITAQIDTMLNDVSITGIKTGMLAKRENVNIVAAALNKHGLLAVIDPILQSSSGTTLLEEKAVEDLKNELLPQASVVTPNKAEAERLSGVTIRTINDTKTAAYRIKDLGPGAVVITGGHYNPTGDTVVDVVYDGHNLFEVPTPRVVLAAKEQTHGTGCIYSSALLAELIAGNTVIDAAQAAQRFVSVELVRRRDCGQDAWLASFQNHRSNV